MKYEHREEHNEADEKEELGFVEPEPMCPCRGDPCPEELCNGTPEEFRVGDCYRSIRKDMKGEADWERWLVYCLNNAPRLSQLPRPEGQGMGDTKR